jgi:hypothetical protein
MATTTGQPARIEDLFDLCRLSGGELDELFRRSPAGAVPDGKADGVFLFLPGTPLGRPLARGLRLAWRGKRFDAGGGRLVNRVSPLGLPMVPARVYEGTSYLDAKPCVVLDYSGMTWIVPMMRDEIREVAPGLYLGLAYWGRIRVLRFALRFSPASRR